MTHSYAVGVMKQFQKDIHPLGSIFRFFDHHIVQTNLFSNYFIRTEKMVSKDGRKWCCDLLDWLIKKDQILQKGEVILKRYTPTASHQSCIIINVYIVENNDSKVHIDRNIETIGRKKIPKTVSFSVRYR